MIPVGLKIDKNGLLYTDDTEILRQHPLELDHRENKDNRYYTNMFFSLNDSSDYILKFSTTIYTRREVKKIKEMLDCLISKQKYITNIDFPIAYYKMNNRLQGLIIKYYQNSISFDDILKNEEIVDLGKYYAHDEDNIHNLFLLFYEILALTQEMYENGIYYHDINPGNIVFFNNQPKIIDFDYRYIVFNDKDRGLKNIMAAYVWLLDHTLKSYGLIDGLSNEIYNYDEAREYTKRLENRVRKNER